MRFLFGILAGLALMLIASWNLENSPRASSETSKPTGTAETANPAQYESSTSTNSRVTRVVDGDTIHAILDSEPANEVKVRFLGVNTPETVDPRRPVECFGKQASDFTKSLLADKRVLLVADPEADEVDKYGRLLRNVYLDDGTDVNAELIRQGYAYAYVSFPQNLSRKAYLRSLEAEARENNRGLWNPDNCASE